MKPTLVLVSSLALLSAGAAAHAQMGIARGRIVDENDKPVAGATVEFEFRGGMNRQYSVETGKDGKYTQIVAPGPYRITANKESFQGAFLDQTIDAGAPTQVPDLKIVSRESLVQAAMKPIMEKFEKAGELTRAGKLDEAAGIFEELAAEHPDIPEVHFNLGTIYGRQQKWEQAEAALKRTLDLAPDNGAAALSLSGVYESTGRMDDAISIMENYLEPNADDARYQYNLAILYVNERRADEARATLEKVLQLDPDNAEVYYLLGNLAVSAGDLEAAIGHLETYLEKAPPDAQYRGVAEDMLPKLREAAAPKPQ